MKLNVNQGGRRGTILIIVLWIAFGLVTLAIYFANSMSMELRASDNRVAGAESDEAIMGALRYVTNVLGMLPEPGSIPDTNTYQYAGVPVGQSYFWLIGQGDNTATPDLPVFGLVDEGSKLNLNTATIDMLQNLPHMTPELAAAIFDWRSSGTTPSTSGAKDETYALLTPAYKCKSAPFETVEELRLVYGMDLDTLYGEDLNLNGALDPNENDGDVTAPSDNSDGKMDPGILSYVTVYSREPNTQTNGDPKVNISRLTAATATSLLQTNVSAARLAQILSQLGLGGRGGGGGGGGRGGPGGGGQGGGTTTVNFTSPLQFYSRSGMTIDEFALIGNMISITNGATIEGRVNVNTASAAVLACLPGMDATAAQQLVSYRLSNPNALLSIAWVKDALSDNTTALQALQAGDYITTQSYQFTADVAAVGHFGRGYRRVKFIVDTSEGTPAVRYRRDLTNLGWALGRQARESLQTALLTSKAM